MTQKPVKLFIFAKMQSLLGLKSHQFVHYDEIIEIFITTFLLPMLNKIFRIAVIDWKRIQELQLIFNISRLLNDA